MSPITVLDLAVQGDPTPALQHLALLEEAHLWRREAVLQ